MTSPKVTAEHPAVLSADDAPSSPPLWEQHARQWSLIKPPLRPCAKDLAPIQQSIDDWASRRADAPTVLILGVTPEYSRLRWPVGTRVFAADISMPMIQSVFPHEPEEATGPYPVQTDWTSLPFADRSFDFVFGDGCYVLLHRTLVPSFNTSIQRILKPEGRFIVRVFLRPDVHDAPEKIWGQTATGGFGNFHTFKFRLLMSLCDESGEVRVADAWRFFRLHCPNPAMLAQHTNWPLDEIQTISAYRGQGVVYWFPTFSAFWKTTEKSFRAVSCLRQDYEMGDLCPTFSLMRKN